MDLVRNIPDAQHASKVLVEHALARFSTDNLSCMVIRLDTHRIKDVINNTAEPIGVDGDPSTNVPHGVSEAEKIVEGARKSMETAGLADDADLAEKTHEATLQRMANANAKQESGPEMATDPPSVKILKPNSVPEETH